MTDLEVEAAWEASTPNERRTACIHHLFQAQVTRVPDAVAVVSGRSFLTYRQLDDRANQVAHALRNLGTGPDSLVGIYMRRSLEQMVALLGILKAGAAYLPLDPSYPSERLQFMLGDAHTRVLLTRSTDAVELLSGPELLQIAVDGDAIRTQPCDALTSGVGSNNLAYVIYTSGSTGKPKGVAIPHRALVGHARGVAQRYRLRWSDRILQFASLSFDVASEEILPSWAAGATVVLAPDDVSVSFAALRQLIEHQRLTVLNLPTHYWQAWVDDLATSEMQLPPSLRLVIVGSERVSARKLRTWQTLVGPTVRWFNAYGTTETTITSTTYEADAAEAEPFGDWVPIGHPLPNTQAFVLDEEGEPVREGTAGELYIGGDSLARGYLNQPALTAARFVAHPYSTDRGARVYRTGDKVRRLPNGALDLIGRLDDQVKLHGYRIEPGEVEAALLCHPAVLEVAVTLREDVPDTARLVAYVVADQPAEFGERVLRTFLEDRLPLFMLPATFVMLDHLPRTPAGKVGRADLPTPSGAGSERGQHLKRAGGEVEAQMLLIWEEVLGVHPIGVDDDFFVLGGYSLRALLLVAYVEKAFGTALPVSVLFEAPTVQKLARKVCAMQTAEEWSSLVTISPAGSKPAFFAVHAVFGDVLCFGSLAHHLGGDRPFYGLQARGLDGVQEPLLDIPSMAAEYIREIRTVQANGPYHVGGFSSGGSVAIEIAHQLRDAGLEVGTVSIFDSPNPATQYNRYRLSISFAIRFADNLLGYVPHWVKTFRTRSAAERCQSIVAKLVAMKRRAREVVDGQSARSVPLDSASHFIKTYYDESTLATQWPTYRRKVLEAQLRAWAAYVPPRYAGRVVLFRAKRQPLFCSLEPSMGWASVAVNGVDVREVPGNHHTLVWDPNVQVLARQLRECLDDEPCA